MVQYFSSEAEYQAAAKSNSESSVSFVGANRTSKFDGRNVVVDVQSAMTGDAVYLDAAGALRFIPYKTLVATTLPVGFTKVGVVLVGVDHEDYRGKVLIGYWDSASKVWSYIYSFKLTGYTLDGTDRTGVLSIRTAADWGTAVDFTVPYNASALDDFITQLNAFFQDATNEVFQTQDWVAVKNGSDVDLQFHFTAWQQSSNAGKSGFTLTANLLPEITASSAMLRYNGARSGEGSILNMPRALAYFRSDLNNATYNPTSDVTSIKRQYPVCLPGYLGTSAYSGGSDRCALLRATYGEGEAGWLRFMQSVMPVRPTAYGPMGDKKTYGDGKTNTYKMAGRTWTGQNGTPVVAFPAADYCAGISFDHELLKKGEWFLPDIDQLESFTKDLRYNTTNIRTADKVNATLNAMGGTAISNGSGAWSSSRYTANLAWFFNGASGYAIYGAMLYALGALPVLLLDANAAGASA